MKAAPSVPVQRTPAGYEKPRYAETLNDEDVDHA
jgi:hypothetical protein